MISDYRQGRSTAEDIDKIWADILDGKQRIVSYPPNQYGPGGTGASTCGLAALNCARIVFRMQEELKVSADGIRWGLDAKTLIGNLLSQETTEDIVSVCSLWPSSAHMEVEEILELPLFKNAFNLVKIKYGRSNYKGFLKMMMDIQCPNNSLVAAGVITRPPEILICLKIPIEHSSSDIFVIFDSHPRPIHPLGSGFILNSSVESAAAYLDKVLAVDSSILSNHSMKWQAELLSQFSTHIIVSKDPEAAKNSINAILMDASMKLLKLKAELVESQQRQSYILAEHKELQTRITHLELRQPDRKGKKKQNYSSGSFRALRGEYFDQESFTPDSPSGDMPKSATQRVELLDMDKFFECRICFETLLRDDIAQFAECKHSFCRDCLRSYIASKLSERRYPVFCPACVADNSREPVAVENDMFESLGPTNSDFIIFQELQMASHSVTLHCRKCQETMFVDRDEYQMSTIILCPLPRCNHTWCKNCLQGIDTAGPQHSCDGSSELQHLMEKQGWRHCPGCQTPIQKESGCNHMTCSSPGCKTHFCYVCGEMIIQSLAQSEIKNATRAHYQKCTLFEVTGGQ